MEKGKVLTIVYSSILGVAVLIIVSYGTRGRLNFISNEDKPTEIGTLTNTNTNTNIDAYGYTNSSASADGPVGYEPYTSCPELQNQLRQKATALNRAQPDRPPDIHLPSSQHQTWNYPSPPQYGESPNYWQYPSGVHDAPASQNAYPSNSVRFVDGKGYTSNAVTSNSSPDSGRSSSSGNDSDSSVNRPNDKEPPTKPNDKEPLMKPHASMEHSESEKKQEPTVAGAENLSESAVAAEPVAVAEPVVVAKPATVSEPAMAVKLQDSSSPGNLTFSPLPGVINPIRAKHIIKESSLEVVLHKANGETVTTTTEFDPKTFAGIRSLMLGS